VVTGKHGGGKVKLPLEPKKKKKGKGGRFAKKKLLNTFETSKGRRVSTPVTGTKEGKKETHFTSQGGARVNLGRTNEIKKK